MSYQLFMLWTLQISLKLNTLILSNPRYLTQVYKKPRTCKIANILIYFTNVTTKLGIPVGM